MCLRGENESTLGKTTVWCSPIEAKSKGYGMKQKNWQTCGCGLWL